MSRVVELRGETVDSGFPESLRTVPYRKPPGRCNSASINWLASCTTPRQGTPGNCCQRSRRGLRKLQPSWRPTRASNSGSGRTSSRGQWGPRAPARRRWKRRTLSRNSSRQNTSARSRGLRSLGHLTNCNGPFRSFRKCDGAGVCCCVMACYLFVRVFFLVQTPTLECFCPPCRVVHTMRLWRFVLFYVSVSDCWEGFPAELLPQGW